MRQRLGNMHLVVTQFNSHHIQARRKQNWIRQAVGMAIKFGYLFPKLQFFYGF